MVHVSKRVQELQVQDVTAAVPTTHLFPNKLLDLQEHVRKMENSHPLKISS